MTGTVHGCGCMECQIRAAIRIAICGQDSKPGPFEVDTGSAICALAEILGELLAHHDTETMDKVFDLIRLRRDDMARTPFVFLQNNDPQGHA